MVSQRSLAAVAMLGVVLYAGNAYAQTRAGMIEVSAATASLVNSSGSGISTTEMAAQGKVGYFFKPELEVSAVVSYSSLSGGGTSATSTSFGAQGDYHFNTTQKIVPFAGVNAGFVNSTGQSSNTYVGADGGAKFFLSTNVSVGPAAYFQIYSNKSITVFTLVGAFSIFF